MQSHKPVPIVLKPTGDGAFILVTPTGNVVAVVKQNKVQQLLGMR